MIIHSTVLTPQEKTACLLAYQRGRDEVHPYPVHFTPEDVTQAHLLRLQNKWVQTRDVRALLAWSEAVGEQSRRLVAEMRAERMKMADGERA